MPIEIKELVIRAIIDYREESRDDHIDKSSESQEADREAIIQACVRQVLQILNRSNHR